MPETSRKNLTAESLWSLLSAVISSFFGILYIVIVGNQWKSNGLGIFSLCASLYLIGSIVCNLGIHGAVLYEVAASGDNKKRAASFVSTSLLMSLALGLLGSVIGFTLAPLIAAAFQQPTMTGMVRLFSFALPLFLINKTGLGILNAHRRMRLIAGINITRGLIILLYLAGAVIFKADLVNIPYGFIIAESLILVLVLAACFRTHRLVVPAIRRAKQLISFGWRVGLSGIITDINARVDILVIGIFWDASIVGIYSIASAATKSLRLIPNAIQRVTNPLIVQLYSSGEKEKLYRTMDVLLRLGTVIFVVIGVAIVVYIKPLITLIYPSQADMIGAAVPLYFLIPGAVIYSGIGMIATAPASSIGKPENALKQILMILGVNILMNFALVPFWGAAGAGFATTTSLLVAMGYFAYLCRRYLDFSLPLARLLLLFCLLCSAVACVAIFENYVPRLLLFVAGLVVFLGVFKALGIIRKSDWKLICDVLRSFAK